MKGMNGQSEDQPCECCPGEMHSLPPSAKNFLSDTDKVTYTELFKEDY